MTDGEIDAKKIKAELSVQVDELEKQRDIVNQMEKKANEEKGSYQRMFGKVKEEIDGKDFAQRKKTAIDRRTMRLSKLSMFSDIKGFQGELFMDIKEDAEMMVEQIFANVCLRKIEGMENREEFIRELKEMIRGKGMSRPKLSFEGDDRNDN